MCSCKHLFDQCLGKMHQDSNKHMEKLLTDRQYGVIFTLLLCICRNSIVSDVWRPYFYQLRSWVVAQEPWVICLRYTCLKRLNIIDVKHIHFPDRLKKIRVYVNGRETNHHEKQSSLFVALEKSTIISLCTVLSRLVGQDRHQRMPCA